MPRLGEEWLRFWLLKAMLRATLKAVVRRRRGLLERALEEDRGAVGVVVTVVVAVGLCA